MKVYIIGANGNMGSRYSAILKYLGHEVWGIDMPYIYLEGGLLTRMDCKESDAVIVATPTRTHLDILEMLEGVEKPILCEKPFIDDEKHLPRLRHFLSNTKLKISMVSQYDWLSKDYQEDGYPTCYDYFKTGKDGLPWDCINIIWNARDKIILEDKNPIWFCKINGHALNLRDMDVAYCMMIEQWLKDPYVDKRDEILKRHQKVVDYLNGKFNDGSNRHTSTQQ